MNYIIDKAVIETTECDKSLSCLYGAKGQLCPAESSIGPLLLLLECKNNKYCKFKMDCGLRLMCSCPIRKEIYKNYGR